MTRNEIIWAWVVLYVLCTIVTTLWLPLSFFDNHHKEPIPTWVRFLAGFLWPLWLLLWLLALALVP